jgi:hypothetical protein
LNTNLNMKVEIKRSPKKLSIFKQITLKETEAAR